MAIGYSLHIGIDNYNRDYEPLATAVNTAKAMKDLADLQGFSPLPGKKYLLTNEDATKEAVINSIKLAAETLIDTDIFLLTYAGHGDQYDIAMYPEADYANEFLVLCDGDLMDYEIYDLFKQFKKGVRIVLVFDCCHSGTLLGMNEFEYNPPSKSASVVLLALDKVIYVTQGETRFISIDKKLIEDLYVPSAPKNIHPKGFFKKNIDPEMNANIISISSCKDGEEARVEGEVNQNIFYFTDKLLGVWNKGEFKGSYTQFYNEVNKAATNPTQEPLINTVGFIAKFKKQKPFTI